MQSTITRGGITVVVANGDGDNDTMHPAFEYKELESSSNVAHAWILAEPKKKFCVHWASSTKMARAKKGMILVCHIYIDGKLVEWGYRPATGVFGPPNQEMEIVGKFCRGEDGEPPRVFPFYFSENASYSTPENLAAHEYAGTIRLVVFWDHPDRPVQDQYPVPDERLVDDLRTYLKRPRPLRIGDTPTHHDRGCVRIHPQSVPTPVIEQEMRPKPENEDGYEFLFHYAHPDWLRMKGIMKDTPEVEMNPPSRAGRPTSSRQAPSSQRASSSRRTSSPRQASLPTRAQSSPPRQPSPPKRTSSVKERMRPKRPRTQI